MALRLRPLPQVEDLVAFSSSPLCSSSVAAPQLCLRLCGWPRLRVLYSSYFLMLLAFHVQRSTLGVSALIVKNNDGSYELLTLADLLSTPIRLTAGYSIHLPLVCLCIGAYAHSPVCMPLGPVLCYDAESAPNTHVWYVASLHAFPPIDYYFWTLLLLRAVSSVCALFVASIRPNFSPVFFRPFPRVLFALCHPACALWILIPTFTAPSSLWRCGA